MFPEDYEMICDAEFLLYLLFIRVEDLLQDSENMKKEREKIDAAKSEREKKRAERRDERMINNNETARASEIEDLLESFTSSTPSFTSSTPSESESLSQSQSSSTVGNSKEEYDRRIEEENEFWEIHDPRKEFKLRRYEELEERHLNGEITEEEYSMLYLQLAAHDDSLTTPTGRLRYTPPMTPSALTWHVRLRGPQRPMVHINLARSQTN
jgi:hypothetical protein